MGKITVVVAATLASVAHTSAAMSQTLCDIECPRERVRFASCDTASVERPPRDRIGIVGKVISTGGGAYCKSRLTVDVVRSSVDMTTSPINIDYDPCMIWTAQRGDLVNVHVWERASPNSGAYTLAPCPN